MTPTCRPCTTLRVPAGRRGLAGLAASLLLLIAGCEATPQTAPADVPQVLPDGADAPPDGVADVAELDQTSHTDAAIDEALLLDASDAAEDAPCGGLDGCPCDSAVDCTSGFCEAGAQGKRCAPLCAVPCESDQVCQTDAPGTAGYCATPACAGLTEGSPCDDANACSDQTTCKAGVCGGGISACECQTDADCSAKNDANLCNGSLFCDLTTNSCMIDPSTVVNCAGVGQGACEAVLCDPPTGACLSQPANEGAACDDGDPCTETACVAGSCSLKTQLCACQTSADCPDDANLCNGQPFCNKTQLPYTCQTNPATVIACPASDDSCLQAVCDPSSGSCGLVAAADGTPCDDGKPCTTADVCLQGSCTSGILTCACTTQADCLGQDDGNLCNGVPYCDVVSGKCALNPASVVVCPSVDNTDCRFNACNPLTGQCAMQQADDGQLCDDLNPCTENDTCAAGECEAGSNICACQKDADCPDDANQCSGKLYCDPASNTCLLNPASVVVCDPGSNPCAPVGCEPASGACVAMPVPASTTCDDGDPCTAVSFCEGGACASGPAVCQCKTDADCAVFATPDLCDGELFCNKDTGACEVNKSTIPVCPTADDTACMVNRCQPTTGACALQARPDGVACDDGNPCSPVDRCDAGACVAGASACACEADADCAYLDDGNLCNGLFYCNKSGKSPVCAFNPATVVVCSQADATACLSFACDAKSGACLPKPLEGPCTDNNVCTVGDTCAAAACLPGPPTSCDDADPCTLDACNPVAGCFATPAPGGPCDDGEVCTADDICTGIDCVGVPVYCDDGELCTDDSCQPEQGCVFVSNTELCNDNDACTVKDRCASGVCKGVTRLCSGDGPCQLAGCVPASGCVLVPVSGPPCNDGNLCTTTDSCAAGLCVGVGVVTCDDGLPCTTDSCDPAQGCLFEPATAAACSDGDACTIDDACADGVCTPGTPLTCEDSNPCTSDSCSSTSGCVHIHNTAGCDDANPCTTTDLCSGGLCAGTGVLDCDDSNPCTNDSCSPASGCVHVNNTASCDDGSACTQGDVCSGGSCVPGEAKVCPDPAVCKLPGVCNPVSGTCTYANKAPNSPCTDTNACTINETCFFGSCNSTTALTCNDNNPCTTDSCNSASGCVFANNTAGCNDNNACTTGDICADGSCAGPGTLTCDDANPCTNDSCEPTSGCTFVNNTASCDDGVACTNTSGCNGGSCAGSSGATQRFAFEWNYFSSIGDFAGSGVGLPDFGDSVFGGKGLLLAGNGYVELGASSGNTNAGGWTLQFWAKFSGAVSYAMLSKRITCGDPEGGWYTISSNSSGHVGVEYYDGTTYLVSSATGAAYNDNAWHHFAFVGTSTALSVYVDGALANATPASGLGGVTETKPLQVGTSSCVGSNPLQNFVGLIDEVSLLDHAATATEVASLALGQCLTK